MDKNVIIFIAKMEAEDFSEALININRTEWNHVPKDSYLQY